jgi:hypothetical protein
MVSLLSRLSITSRAMPAAGRIYDADSSSG